MRLMVTVPAQQHSLGLPVDMANLGKPVTAIHIRMRKLVGATPMLWIKPPVMRIAVRPSPLPVTVRLMGLVNQG